MKQLSRIAFCLPLLMLTIEHTPEDSTYSQLNASATHQQWRLAISSSRADDDEDDVERIEIIGTQPPPFNPLPPGAGGGGGGGAGGNWGGGGNETPPDPDDPEEERRIQLLECEHAAGIEYGYCLGIVAGYTGTGFALCSQLGPTKLGLACAAFIAVSGGGVAGLCSHYHQDLLLVCRLEYG